MLEDGSVAAAARGGRGQQARPAGTRTRRHLPAVRRPAAAHRLPRSGRRPDRDRVRADRGRQGPDRAPPRRRRRGGDPVQRDRYRRSTASTPTGPCCATPTPPATRHEVELRRHRRVRRVPRHLPARDPGRRADDLGARLSVRLARHPRRRAAIHRRAHLRPPPRTGSRCTACAAPRSAGSTCRSTRTRKSGTGRTTGSGTELSRRLELPGWALRQRPGAGQGHHPDAQLRQRADAIRTPVPGRGRRAYRAADRSQGPQPRARRRRRARPGAGRPAARRRRAGRGRLLRHLPEARLAVHPLLLVDDDDAAPDAGCRRHGRRSCSCPSCGTSSARGRPPRHWPRTTPACRFSPQLRGTCPESNRIEDADLHAHYAAVPRRPCRKPAPPA